MNNRFSVPCGSCNCSLWSIPAEPAHPAELGAAVPGELDQLPPAREQQGEQRAAVPESHPPDKLSKAGASRAEPVSTAGTTAGAHSQAAQARATRLQQQVGQGLESWLAKGLPEVSLEPDTRAAWGDQIRLDGFWTILPRPGFSQEKDRDP